MKKTALLGLVMAAVVLTTESLAQSVSTVISQNMRDPHSLVVVEDGNMYISDEANNRILKYSPDNASFVTVAGTADYPAGYQDGVGFNARFNNPRGMVQARGGLVVADYGNHCIRYVGFNGLVTNLAGMPGSPGKAIDGQGTNAHFLYPAGLATDPANNIYVADTKSDAIRFIDGSNNVITLISNLFEPSAVQLAIRESGTNQQTGDLWIADTRRHVIWEVTNLITFHYYYSNYYVVTTNLGAIVSNRMVNVRMEYVLETNRTKVLRAGSIGRSGLQDADLAAGQALLNKPQGMIWLGHPFGLMVCDSGNNALRRLYYNTNVQDYSMLTYVGMTGESGFKDGLAAVASLSTPVSMVSDMNNGGFLVVDRANNAIRRIQVQPPLPRVPPPRVGHVVFIPSAFCYVSKLIDVQNMIFDNDVRFEIEGTDGTETFFTYGPTPTNSLDDSAIPKPGVFSGDTPYYYRDGMCYEVTPPSLFSIQPAPDILIKAISTMPERQPSQVVQARFQFKVANPSIIGENAADISITCNTEGAVIYYSISDTTIDLEDEANAPGPQNPNSQILQYPRLPVGNIDRDIIVSARAFKNRYKPSTWVKKKFALADFKPVQITFGFESGECSSDYIAASGQTYFAPVTLATLPNTIMYGLQFNIAVTNLDGAPPVPFGAVGFQSMLKAKATGWTPDLYLTIPPAWYLVGTNAVSEVPYFNQFLYTNAPMNLLAVGWMERYPHGLDWEVRHWYATNWLANPLDPFFRNMYDDGLGLYDSKKQDLITFSSAKDTLFLKSGNRVIVGAYTFDVPTNAVMGDTYQISIGRPSATSDGIAEDLYILSPKESTNTGPGSLNGLKHVRVGQPGYIIGDVTPFRWFNAGDFGDTNILVNDLTQILEHVVYPEWYTPPHRNSDLFRAMDASDGTFVGTNYHNFTNISATLINSITNGDGVLAVDDLFVTFWRSLDPTLKWYGRYWSNGVLNVREVPNTFRGSLASSVPLPKPSALQLASTGASTLPPSVRFTAGDVTVGGGAGTSVPVPIMAEVQGAYPIRVLALRLSVRPVDGSPALTVPVGFSPSSLLGPPSRVMAMGNGEYSAIWLDPSVPGISGSGQVGTLYVSLPPTVTAQSAYVVAFGTVSASPNGLAILPATVQNGVVSMSGRSGSSWGDGISDAWRIKSFGTLSNLLSAAEADADGDGMKNWQEYRAGTDPVNLKSKLEVKAGAVAGLRGVKLSWPTVSNKRYVLECINELLSTNWMVIQSNIPGTGNLQELMETNFVNQAKFYRVRLQE